MTWRDTGIFNTRVSKSDDGDDCNCLENEDEDGRLLYL